MKKKLLLRMMCGCIAAGVFAGCLQGNEPAEEGATGQEITLRTDPVDEVNFLMEAEGVTIDWGDGSKTEYEALEFDELEFDSDDPYGDQPDVTTHTYDSEKAWKVTVRAEELTKFVCCNNDVTTLNVSKCTVLTYLDCYENNLTELDASKCKTLNELWCAYNNLTKLDVSKCAELTRLDCYTNDLTALDVSKCTELTYLDGGGNSLTALDVSKCPALTKLFCDDNSLTALDVSKCTALTMLNCKDNNFTASALNALFESLPDVDSGDLYIGGNPGASTCNRSIATGKGWSVDYQ